MKQAVRHRQNIDRTFCIVWWLIIVGLAAFWVGIAVLAFGGEYDERNSRRPFDSWLNWEDKDERVGEIHIDYEGERMIIYDKYRRNPKEYIMRDHGDGTYRVEPMR